MVVEQLTGTIVVSDEFATLKFRQEGGVNYAAASTDGVVAVVGGRFPLGEQEWERNGVLVVADVVGALVFQ